MINYWIKEKFKIKKDYLNIYLDMQMVSISYLIKIFRVIIRAFDIVWSYNVDGIEKVYCWM